MSINIEVRLKYTAINNFRLFFKKVYGKAQLGYLMY